MQGQTWVFVLWNFFHNSGDTLFKTQQLEGFDKREERKRYQIKRGSFYFDAKRLEDFSLGKQKQKRAFEFLRHEAIQL